MKPKSDFKITTVTLHEQMLEHVDRRATAQGLTRSEAIRRALRAWLSDAPRCAPETK